MKKLNLIGGLALLPMATIPAAGALTGCSNKTFLDYSDTNNYIYHKTVSNARYDVIFFVGTSIMKQTQDNGVGFDAEQMKQTGYSNYCCVGSQLTDVDSNVFAPLYRQMSLQYSLTTYTNHNGIIDDIGSKEPYQDLKAYLDYYFTKVNKNAERPFVLAGHSQGAAAVQIVLEKYFINGGHKAYLKNMVAAYSIGYGVSIKWFNNLDTKIDGKPVIHLATGADDYNCLISWNTEGNGENKGKSFLLADDDYDTYVINPLNWKTLPVKSTANQGILLNDTTTNQSNVEVPKGYRIATSDEGGEKGEKNLMDAQIDEKRGSVICSTNKDFVSIDGQPIWGGESLHTYDGRGYYMNMANNIQVRLKNFIK